MRVDKTVPPDQRTGLSTYYHDYKQRLGEKSKSAVTAESFRSNRPHPKKNFLEPRSRPESANILQNRVRSAVREYLDQLYYSKQQQTVPVRPSPQQYTSYPFVRDARQKAESLQPQVTAAFPGVSGKSTLKFDGDKPAYHIAAERYPTPNKSGESKYDRSVRIDQEIRKSNRICTPQPQPSRWQVEATPPPIEKQPHWIDHPVIGKPRKRPRISSAPPDMQNYSYYEQSARPNTPQTKPMTNRLEDWAANANDYEKQVVYNMLKNVSGPVEGGRATPPVPQEAYNILTGKYPAYYTANPPKSPERFNDFPETTSYKQTFSSPRLRKTNSAPMKGMLGLVPHSTQMPHRDQRDFRLQNQDNRVPGHPENERMLKEYLHKMATHKRNTQNKKKFLIVPMHSHPKQKGVNDKDYKCDVSFFQSVRSPFKSHFVIHPDFTSEDVHRKKHVNQMITHFRY